MRHVLAASKQTVRRGVFDAAFPPVLTVESGDTVTIECITGGRRHFPPAHLGRTISPALQEILGSESPDSMASSHIITGPVAVNGAEPGDMLEVRIDDVQLGADWGYNVIIPTHGALPGEFSSRRLTHISIDLERKVALLPWGTALPLSPFFGILAVAPLPSLGTLGSREPRVHGGNIDLKDLTPGSTLFLPVWAHGAGFCAGDGHAAQGDGEVGVAALETCLNGTFTLVLHKGNGPDNPRIRMPRAETPQHFISLGLHEDLDEALKQAVREMIAFICERSHLSREDAYILCSLAVDFHVTQAVNGEKGIHGKLRRDLLP